MSYAETRLQSIAGSASEFESSYLNDSDKCNLSAIANELAIEAGKIPKRLYCPFCLFDFGFEFLLKSHIQEVHAQEIKLLSEIKPDSVKTDICSCCGAKFYIHGLLPKHVIRKHQDCIVGLTSTLDAENAGLGSGILHTTDRNYDTTNANTNSSHDYQNLKPILKRGNLHSDCLNETNPFEVRRRKLRFNLPDTSFTSIGSDKENRPLKNLAKRSLSLRIKKQKKKPVEPNPPVVDDTDRRNVLGDITDKVHETYSSNIEHNFSHIIELPFQCASCSKKFSNNSMLLKHVKKKHGKIHFNAVYKCGLCKAKFFRNCYLVRHNKLHDKPERSSAASQYEPLQNDAVFTNFGCIY